VQIEYHLVRFFDEERRTAISLTAPELVHALEAQDKAMKLCVSGEGTLPPSQSEPHPF